METDTMVHCSHKTASVYPKDQPCVRCAGRYVTVVGRLDDGLTVILECDRCGTHFAGALLDSVVTKARVDFTH